MLVALAFSAFASTQQSIHAETNRVIRSVAELASAIRAERVGAHFDITATVTFPCNSVCCTFAVEDETGAVAIREDAFFPKCPMKAGDRVRLKGSTFRYPTSGAVAASNNEAEILSHDSPPQPMELTSADKSADRCENRLVRLGGIVRDAFVDEIDPLWGYLVLQDGLDSFYATFSSPTQNVSSLSALVGARVSLTGLYATYIVGSRQIDGMQVLISGLDAVDVVRPAPKDPFEVPNIESVRRSHASIISGMERRRASGRVIAVWHGDRLLLRTADGRILRVDLAERKPPKFGENVDVAGNLETDLYRFNLSRAIWRPSPADKFQAEPCPLPVLAKQLLTDDLGRPAVQVRYHGQPIRIQGVVRTLPSPSHRYDRLGLECDKRIVPIDASACPHAFDGIEIGCVLEVSGTCLVETENWRPYVPFPHVDGIAVVVRTPEDVRIISRPPWWTPGRLMVVIGALLAALAGIFLWNRSLNKLAEARGRELAEESRARISSELKVGERTRLAIELHDALSQNLTGVSLEIATAEKLAAKPPNPDVQRSTLHHLDIAARSLKSCRDELRNCIWDLRNYALEEADMNDAVRRTLAPFVNGICLVVRFNVARESLSDNTAHALLRIIRELVQNAIRHGRAKTVRIAGCLDGEHLLFSVEDDGRGFDPEMCPGVQQGHFGLQGIRERVNQFGGTMSIKSKTGVGTKVTISILNPLHSTRQGGIA